MKILFYLVGNFEFWREILFGRKIQMLAGKIFKFENYLNFSDAKRRQRECEDRKRRLELERNARRGGNQ